ncbi:hypothetical protein M413DRAFT_14103 [Hebeloma cylindrosporum]|uniref:Uncharacterized protein n=1 Tax=Hebeloma cylindrosporum TaxID=76867 RepID=A0A0C3BW27_HEBCY|nr:hypothetical protein M413DRAFT_14103 [Hebeloma cylindrosporum h7]
MSHANFHFRVLVFQSSSPIHGCGFANSTRARAGISLNVMLSWALAFPEKAHSCDKFIFQNGLCDMLFNIAVQEGVKLRFNTTVTEADPSSVSVMKVWLMPRHLDMGGANEEDGSRSRSATPTQHQGVGDLVVREVGWKEFTTTVVHEHKGPRHPEDEEWSDERSLEFLGCVWTISNRYLSSWLRARNNNREATTEPTGSTHRVRRNPAFPLSGTQAYDLQQRRSMKVPVGPRQEQTRCNSATDWRTVTGIIWMKQPSELSAGNGIALFAHDASDNVAGWWWQWGLYSHEEVSAAPP